MAVKWCQTKQQMLGASCSRSLDVNKTKCHTTTAKATCSAHLAMFPGQSVIELVTPVLFLRAHEAASPSSQSPHHLPVRCNGCVDALRALAVGNCGFSTSLSLVFGGGGAVDTSSPHTYSIGYQVEPG